MKKDIISLISFFKIVNMYVNGKIRGECLGFFHKMGADLRKITLLFMR